MKHTRQCPYSECPIPKDNSKYWWQIIYLTISFFYLIQDKSEFTMFALFLFVFPVLLDLIYGPIKNNVLNIIRIIFIVVNAFISTYCFLGLAGFITDTESQFKIVETSLLFSNFAIDKQLVALILLVNLLIPVMYYFGAPNKKAMVAANRINKISFPSKKEG